MAAISIVAYNGIQGRARDNQRMQDMSTIIKALEMYKTANGNYPMAVGTPNAGGWQVSHDGTSATNFLSALTGNNGISNVPVDPTNKGIITGANSLAASRSGDDFMYFYHRYNAGYGGCDASKGNFYVLGVTRLDEVPINQTSPKSPGFSCTTNWSFAGAWVTGSFVN